MEDAVTEYGLTQAAARADLDTRAFRVLADKNVVLATPETRTAPRGKARFYNTNEIIIARIVGEMMKFGMTTTALSGMADWIREHSGRFFKDARDGEPVFIRIRLSTPESWSGDFARVQNADVPGKQVVDAFDPKDRGKLAYKLLLINLAETIEKVEFDWIGWIKTSVKPSLIVELLDEKMVTTDELHETFPGLAGHTYDEVANFLTTARHAAAENGDDWNYVFKHPDTAE